MKRRHDGRMADGSHGTNSGARRRLTAAARVKPGQLRVIVPLIVAAICWPGRVHGADESPGLQQSAFSFQGFGTLGAARSNTGDVHVMRNIRQREGISKHWSVKEDSVIGAQVQYRFSDRVSAMIQAASYYREDGTFEPDVTAAFVKFDPSPRFSVRLGRVPMDMLMLADTRMVGYSYIPIRPASEFYSVPLNYVDGINARWRIPVGEGILSLDGTAGYAREDLPKYHFSGAKAYKGMIDYQVGDWQFRYYYAKAKLAHDNPDLVSLRQYLGILTNPALAAYDPALAASAAGISDRFEVKNQTSVYESLGVGYDDGAWQVQVVIDAMKHDNASLTNGKGLHAFFGRRIGAVTPYFAYSRNKTEPKHAAQLPAPLYPMLPLSPTATLGPLVTGLNTALAQAMYSSRTKVNSETYTIGARWDFRRNWALKAQIEHLRGGKPVSSFADTSNVKSRWNGKATLFCISLDFVF
ncbi:MAG: hypothetical protein LBS70_03900 [Candidatus Accumulibacter sp.]|jgi:hypothetical protein|nr:hypothetical protein [Accumulibacter sp.]